MNARFRRVKEIFLAAVEKEHPDERDGYVRAACGEDEDVRRQVDALLGKHAQAGSFLEPASPSMVTTVEGLVGERPGTMIGAYKLLEPIGEGGFAVVYLAEQLQPVRRKVGLKVLKPGMDTRQVVARFEAERQALAIMDHPNIAKVLDGGATESGRPYFVMELVKGVPITDFCDQNHLTLRQRLELCVSVCQAVQHAHQKGIIHRDLKPSNILVTAHDGAPVVKVIDFGVAKALGQELTDRTLFTGLAQMIGTPLYMSPEQAGQSGLDIDTRSDIYSLGVLLYELLTGTTPFDRKRFKRAELDEVRRIIREEEPPRPSTRISSLGEPLATVSAKRKSDPKRLKLLLRGELDWIVMKCLEKDRNRRYETANALARDVECYLHDEPVQACPPSAMYRFGKFTRRNKRALLSLGVLALAVLVGLGSLAVGNARALGEAREKTKALTAAKESEREAQRQSAVAKRERDMARRNLYVAHMNLAQTHWENANVSRVEELLDLYQRVEPGQEDLRGWEWYYQERLCQAYLRNLRGHNAPIVGVAFSPDRTRLTTGSDDQMVKVWDVATGRELSTFQGSSNRARRMAVSPDGTRVAISEDNTVKLWDVASGKELRTFRGDNRAWQVFSLAFSPDGTRLARCDGTATVWDVATGKVLCRLRRGYSVAFSPDGTRVATSESTVSGGLVGGSFDVTVWDVKSARELVTFRGHSARVTTMHFSQDGTRLASGSFDKTVKVWDVASGKELRTLQGHKSWALSVAFSPDGTRLASGGYDQTVKVWDVASAKELRTFRGHNDWVTTVAFSPDGARLASGSSDAKVMLWEVANHQECRTLPGTSNGVTTVAFSPEGTRLASGSYKSVTLSEVASGKVLRTLSGGVNIVAFSPDGKRLATGGSHDRSIRLWDVASGKELHTFQGPRRGVGTAEQVNTLAFSPDGKRLASGSHHQAVKLWDVASGKELRALQGDNMIWSVAFSRDGTRLASNDGQTIKLWDVASGEKLRTLQGHTEQVVSVAFSPDGTRLASGSNDRTVKVWDVASAKELRALRGHRGPVGRVAFSPDGARLASGSVDHTVKVWDVASGQELRTLRHEGLVGPVAFSPDGTVLATGSDGTVRVWDATPLTAKRRAGQEPRGRLELLFSKPLTKAEVGTRLRGDATISEAGASPPAHRAAPRLIVLQP
jgi:WD40 repeat protein/serine/threonine protein kinase